MGDNRSRPEKFRIKLKQMFELSEFNSFEEFLIDHAFRNHEKSVKLAGDIGEALSMIGELERKVKHQEIQELK